MDDLDLRRHVYRTIADTGLAPTAAEIAEIVGGPDEAAAHLQRLDDRHFVVLGDDGEIAMALPFAAKPTGHRVIHGERSWWLDDDTPVDLRIENGRIAMRTTRGYRPIDVLYRRIDDDFLFF